MYAEFFGLSELPFNNTPDPRFFYATPDHEEALASMIYAVSERKGFMLLTGENGVGKTLLTNMLMLHFRSHICAAMLNHAAMSGDDLLASVCNELGVPVLGNSNPATCIRVLHDFLLAQYVHGTPVVLVIDESQALPSESFEQLRMLGNLEHDSAKLLQILLIGQPELRPLFQAPYMRQLRQRIFRTFHLPALSLERSHGYIQHRLNAAGAEDATIFDDSAVEAIYQYSRGLPRSINTVCDNTMLSAYAADLQIIDGKFVEGVISQMLTLDQRHAPRDESHGIGVSGESGYGEVGDQRISRAEVEYHALTDRIRRLEAGSGPRGESPDHVTTAQVNRQELDSMLTRASDWLFHAERTTELKLSDLTRRTDEKLATVQDNMRRTNENMAADMARKTDEKLAATLETAQNSTQQVLTRTEQRLTDVVKNTDQRLTSMVQATEDLLRRMPKIASSSSRRDKQMRRLTSIVKRLAEDSSSKRMPPAAELSARTRSFTFADSGSRNTPPPVAAASGRLKELVHQSRTLMGELRSTISDFSHTGPAQTTTQTTALPVNFDSPVAALADEVKQLSDLAEKL